MSKKFYSTDMKIGRAEFHINSLQKLINKIPIDSYKLKIERVIDREGETAGQATYVTKLESDPLPDETSLIFGDVVLNLRAAIDHCYAESIGAHGSEGYVKFPIATCEKQWRRMALKAKKKVLRKKTVKFPMTERVFDCLN